MSSLPSAGVDMLVGLGNPGRAYQRNRHNVGYMLVDQIVRTAGAGAPKSKRKALLWEADLAGSPLMLAKPQTFMNESGVAVSALLKALGIPLDRLLIAFDDLDLPLGEIRMRPFGGSSGHNGMKSIIQHLRSQSFARMRIGISRPPGSLDPAEYVLRDFSPDELAPLQLALDRAAEGVRIWLIQGLEAAMLFCNTNQGAAG